MAFYNSGEKGRAIKNIVYGLRRKKERKAFIKVATEETSPQTHYLSFSQNREKKACACSLNQRNLREVVALKHIFGFSSKKPQKFQ